MQCTMRWYMLYTVSAVRLQEHQSVPLSTTLLCGKQGMNWNVQEPSMTSTMSSLHTLAPSICTNLPCGIVSHHQTQSRTRNNSNWKPTTADSPTVTAMWSQQALFSLVSLQADKHLHCLLVVVKLQHAAVARHVAVPSTHGDCPTQLRT